MHLRPRFRGSRRCCQLGTRCRGLFPGVSNRNRIDHLEDEGLLTGEQADLGEKAVATEDIASSAAAAAVSHAAGDLLGLCAGALSAGAGGVWEGEGVDGDGREDDGEDGLHFGE